MANKDVILIEQRRVVVYHILGYRWTACRPNVGTMKAILWLICVRFGTKHNHFISKVYKY